MILGKRLNPGRHRGVLGRQGAKDWTSCRPPWLLQQLCAQAWAANDKKAVFEGLGALGAWFMDVYDGL